MLPEEKTLEEYKNKTLDYLRNRFGDFSFNFNHFGFKTSEDMYEALKKKLSKKSQAKHEIKWKNKKIFTVKYKNVIYEISQLREKDKQKEMYFDHISFFTPDFTKVKRLLKDKIVSSFDVGMTHGIKIPFQGLDLEIRNNDILESEKDFK